VSGGRGVVVGLLLAAGLWAAIVAGIYITQPASALPAVIPGHAATGITHYTERGVIAAVVAFFFFGFAAMVAERSR
jgi:hypothetical protein